MTAFHRFRPTWLTLAASAAALLLAGDAHTQGSGGCDCADAENCTDRPECCATSDDAQCCGDQTMCSGRANQFPCCGSGGNCTWYAEYHAECVWGLDDLGCTGDAGDWMYTCQQRYTSGGAVAGSIFVVAKGAGFPWGHVGAVVSVAENGDFDTIEQDCGGPFGTQRRGRLADYASGFIHVTRWSQYLGQAPLDDTSWPVSTNVQFQMTFKNTGSSPWPTQYALKLVGDPGGFTNLPVGNRILVGAAEPVTVPPNGEKTFRWTMTTPSTAGVAQTTWQVVDWDDVPLGRTAFIRIKVEPKWGDSTTCSPDGPSLWCSSGHCKDGVCCDTECAGACRTCKMAGSEGICSLEASGYADPACPHTALCKAVCGASGACYYPSLSSQKCTGCNGDGSTYAMSDDSRCGTIDCDGRDTACRNYYDLTANRCVSGGPVGACKTANSSYCTSYANNPTYVPCRPQTCSNGTVYRTDYCDGSGNCSDKGSYACSYNYGCNGNGCATTCPPCRSGYRCAWNYSLLRFICTQ